VLQGLQAGFLAEVPTRHAIKKTHARFFQGAGGVSQETDHVRATVATPTFRDIRFDT